MEAEYRVCRYVTHFFAEILDNLLNQNRSKNNNYLSKEHTAVLKVVFLYPVTE
jgi:hypothetical protein